MNYNEATLRYFETAPGAGVLIGPATFRGAAGSCAHGTWVQFDLQMSSGIIQAARFLAFGCPHTIAVAAWVAEQAAGQELRAALPETVQQLSDRFAVPVEKRGRLLIVEDAWIAATRGALVHCGAALDCSPVAPTSRG
jgi:NifU-like protein involved in Fe-S cluster formation